MPDYRRWYRPGGTFFFTVVTYRRMPIFTCEDAVACLRSAFAECMNELPMTIDAIVILPDHFHLLMTLPDGDQDYSKRLGVIKAKFSSLRPPNATRTAVSIRRHESENWQPRFWEHEVRDEDEAAAFADYIHYNPVKHGLVKCPHDWRWSSFHRWVEKQWLEPDWGCCCRSAPTIRDFIRLAKFVGE